MNEIFAPATIIALAVLGCLLSRADAASPESLEMIWNNSPAPFRKYAPCGRTDGDFCVPDGEWWGVCRSKQFGKAEQSLKSGRITIADEGAVSFSACPYYTLLLDTSVAKRLGSSPQKAGFGSDACSLGYVKWVVRIGARIHSVEIDNAKSVLKLHSEPAPKAEKGTDLCEMKQGFNDMRAWPFDPGISKSGLQTEGDWRISMVADLDGDGVPEILLSARLKGFGPDEAGVLVAPRGNQLEIVAKTVTKPDLFLKSPERKAVFKVRKAKEECGHWGGEEAYNADRARQIKEGAEKACAEFERELKKARATYPDNLELKALSTQETVEPDPAPHSE